MELDEFMTNSIMQIKKGLATRLDFTKKDDNNNLLYKATAYKCGKIIRIDIKFNDEGGNN